MVKPATPAPIMMVLPFIYFILPFFSKHFTKIFYLPIYK